MFKDDPQFESVWTSSTRNADVVFGREVRVRRLRARADDRADAGGRRRDASATTRRSRIRAWLSTVSDDEIRALDQHLLLDLLKIETRPDAWSGVLDTAIANIDQLVLVGDLTLASQLLEAIVAIAQGPGVAVCRAGRGRRHQAGRGSDGAPPRDVPAEGDRHGIRRRQENVHDHRPGAGQADVRRADGRRQRAHGAAAARHPDLVRTRRRASTPTS